MPTCLDCGIRVPPVEDWERVNGCRVKPCMCGAPKEAIKVARREQDMRAYRATIRRIAMSPLPSRLIVRDAMDGRCDLTHMGISALESRYGPQWEVWHKIPNPRLWARVRDDIMAEIGGPDADSRREMKYSCDERRCAMQLVGLLGLSLRTAWRYRGSGISTPKEDFHGWGTGLPSYDSFYDSHRMYEFLRTGKVGVPVPSE